MKQPDKVKTWDDLIFENRNKEYGAYFNRKKYPSALLVGLLFSFLVGFSVLLTVYLDTLHNQITEYQEMFQFISVPLDMSELKSLENTNEKKIKNNSEKHKNTHFRITDSLSIDSAVAEKKKNIKENQNNKIDSLKLDSALAAQKKKNENSNPDSVFTVKDLPQFPGGQTAFNAYIINMMSLSEDIKNNKIHGIVQICFSIDKFGNPVNIYIKKTINADLDKVLCEIIKNMPKWTPSRKYNENIKLIFTVPIIL
jgi:protein TonB